MPGTVKIWWHDGAAIDARRNDIPVVNEPELGFEAVAVSATPAIAGPAPTNTAVALIETDVPVRYRVRRTGEIVQADNAESKLIVATGGVDFIALAEGWTISFVEA